MIETTRTPRSGLGESLTLIEYSSVLPGIYEARRPLHVSNPTYPCLKTSVSGFSSTSTNTVALVSEIQTIN